MTEFKKTIDGKENPKYIDLLDEDAPIAGQKFVCMSFLSPEKIIVKKDEYFFQQFVNQWEYSKSMEKFVAFLNFVSHKYHYPYIYLLMYYF